MVDSVTPTSRLNVLLAPAPGGSDTWSFTVRTLLKPLGVELIVAHTGREALELLESRPIHVAILDHRMPQLGGLQVLKLVREHRAQAHASADAPGLMPAAILLADHLSTPLLHEALSMSVFTVLSKPVNHDQLLDALARAMRRFHNSQWPDRWPQGHSPGGTASPN